MATRSDIIGFLKRGSAWNIHPDRHKTREACAEVLGRLPEDVRDYIMKSKRLILIAPAPELMGAVHPYSFESTLGDHPKTGQA